jgi:hypothetical protein
MARTVARRRISPRKALKARKVHKIRRSVRKVSPKVARRVGRKIKRSRRASRR